MTNINTKETKTFFFRRAVEDGTRRLAAERNISLDVYTGTHGILRINDTDGTPQEIYLDVDNKKVPVPKVFYKLLIDRSNDSGIVLVGVNNPHISIQEILQDYVFCENDISSQIKYIKWKPKDIRRGYSYACEVSDFLENVPHLFNVSVESILT